MVSAALDVAFEVVRQAKLLDEGLQGHGLDLNLHHCPASGGPFAVQAAEFGVFGDEIERHYTATIGQRSLDDRQVAGGNGVAHPRRDVMHEIGVRLDSNDAISAGEVVLGVGPGVHAKVEHVRFWLG